MHRAYTGSHVVVSHKRSTWQTIRKELVLSSPSRSGLALTQISVPRVTNERPLKVLVIMHIAWATNIKWSLRSLHLFANLERNKRSASHSST